MKRIQPSGSKSFYDAFTTYIDCITAMCRAIPYTFFLGSLSLF